MQAAGGRWTSAELLARRDAYRHLSARFPGALRELDSASAGVLEAKAEAVAEEIASDRPLSRVWIAVVLDFHETVRRILDAKARGEIGRAPEGRLMTLVWAELEGRHGRSRLELTELVFGPQR